ncbi:UDPGT domain-containing protein [Cephalotus follicularis]|uniref:UDPGT domain-containing protein n=1 Tax=Cephalotus follicularis TaxID=3775 RepID=A0A1Q3BCX3_CEPFO|nr:UDPGT domain-containing protein [Cephalotus follicularis]
MSRSSPPPHILAVPYPAQGHVIPLMELSLCLANHGFRVTFVNTEFNHKRVVNALAEKKFIGDQIHLVWIPDGLQPWEDRNELGKLSEAILEVMPGKLEELINKLQDDKITCVIADESMGWALEVADRLKIRRVAFWPAAAAMLALKLCVPKLIDDGIIENDGTIIKKQMIQLSPTMPSMNTVNFPWACFDELTTQKTLFYYMQRNNRTTKLANWVICNSAIELEPPAFTTLAPEIIPIGPLLASSRLGSTAGYFWPQDSTCLKWLDQQLPQSVIYVAFGSFTVLEQTQFQELALGLELSNRPFLWVVRPDAVNDQANDSYPQEGYLDRIGTRGQLVGWAPQQKVLSHPSIACFLSHCGWNSTLEGLSNGVPFLSWPYFADQFFNESYVCDVWKEGLKFNRNESGIITQVEIKDKVEQVLGDYRFKARALQMKEMVMRSVTEGGNSHMNFNNFIKWMKA